MSLCRSSLVISVSGILLVAGWITAVAADDHTVASRLTVPEGFLTGFLPPKGKALGRPVDVLVDIDGSLVISDDAGGRLFRVRFVGGD